MESPDPQRNHVRFIVCCITVLGVACITAGTVLVFKGYHADILLGGAIGAISGLSGFLGAGRPNAPQQDIKVSGQPPEVELSSPTKKEPTQ